MAHGRDPLATSEAAVMHRKGPWAFGDRLGFRSPARKRGTSIFGGPRAPSCLHHRCHRDRRCRDSRRLATPSRPERRAPFPRPARRDHRPGSGGRRGSQRREPRRRTGDAHQVVAGRRGSHVHVGTDQAVRPRLGRPVLRGFRRDRRPGPYPRSQTPGLCRHIRRAFRRQRDPVSRLEPPRDGGRPTRRLRGGGCRSRRGQEPSHREEGPPVRFSGAHARCSRTCGRR